MSMDPALPSSWGWNFIHLHDFWSSLTLQPRDTQDMHTPWMVPLPELAAFSSPSPHAVTMPPSSMLCLVSHKPHALHILAKAHQC